MRNNTLIPALVACLVAAVLALPAAADDDHVTGRAWLTVTQIAERLEAAGYRNIEKIEREHGGYEARATGPDGRRARLRLNPLNGEIEPRKKASSRRDAALAGRLGAECSERRCRDDLPPAAPAAGR